MIESLVIEHLGMQDYPSSTPKNVSRLTIPMIGGGSGYYIRDIDGLTPSEISYDTRSLPYNNMSKFGRVKYQPRQIILTLGFDEFRDSVYRLRTDLYQYFTTGYSVRLTFNTLFGTFYIDAAVKTHESNIFSQEPLSQITMEAENPFFRRDTDYEFPIEDFTAINRQVTFPIALTGLIEVPTGVELTWHSGGITNNFVSDLRIRMYASEYISDVQLKGVTRSSQAQNRLFISGIEGERGVFSSSSTTGSIRFSRPNYIDTTSGFTLPFIYPSNSQRIYINTDRLAPSAWVNVRVPILKAGL